MLKFFYARLSHTSSPSHQIYFYQTLGEAAILGGRSLTAGVRDYTHTWV